MKKQYHFCFIFNNIRLINKITQQLGSLINFKIYLIRDGKILGETDDIFCYLNEYHQAIFEKAMIRYEICEDDAYLTPNLQIKLVRVQQNNQQILIGTYQFNANNYIRINNDLNRHCLNLDVEIGQNFSISYEVFMDRFKEGVDQIMHEHYYSLLNQQSQEQDAFFNEAELFPSNTKVRQINLHSDQSIIFHQRYWSPKNTETKAYANFFQQKKIIQKKHSISSMKNQTQNNQIESSKKIQSTIDDGQIRALSQVNSNQVACLEYEFDSNSDEGNQQKTIRDIYKTIHSNSKIKFAQSDIIQFNKNGKVQRTHSKVGSSKNKNVKYAKPLKNMLAFFVLFILSSMLLLHFYQQREYIK